MGKRGLDWNRWRKNHYGWDFIFSGEEEGGLVVEGNCIFSMLGEVYFRNLLKAREIMGEDRPWELRRLGREVRGLNEGDWRRRGPNVVYTGNRAKFLQNEGARRELFESREKVLVEASRGDRFWGIRLGMGGREIQVNGRVQMF